MIADMFSFLTGPITFLMSAIILLVTGVFVSHFVGDQIIISGLRRVKKLAEKTETEVKTESVSLEDIKVILERIDRRLPESGIKPNLFKL